MRRRPKNYEDSRIHNYPISALTTKEKLIVAYYVMKITRDCENERVYDDCSIWDSLLSLVKATNKMERFEAVLEAYITDLKNHNRFHIIPAKKNSRKSHYEDTDFYEEEEIGEDDVLPMEYTEDRIVARAFTFSKSNLLPIKFMRCIVAEDSGTLSRIIALTFFVKDYKKAILTKKIHIPQNIIKLSQDISKIEFLKNELALSDIECRYLLLRYRKVTINLLNYVMSQYSDLSKDLYPKLLDVSIQEYTKILRSDQKLMQFGFLNEEREISLNLIECIENQDFSLYFTDLIKPMKTENSYALDSFSVSQEKQNVMQELLHGRNPVSILLYGKPGSGKTEFSKALINSCGKKAYIFKNESECLSKSEVLSRLNCFLSINKNDSILIVDEADTLLQTHNVGFFGMQMASESKGIVNKMLENSKNKIIWIVNHISQIEDSTKRRFTLSCKFEAMSPEMLKAIAAKKLNSANLDSETKEQILSLLGSYHVTGASVDNIVKIIESFSLSKEKTAGNNQRENLIHNVEIILKENSLLLNGNTKMREKVSSAYDCSVLNTSIPSEKIIKMVKNAQAFSEKNKGTENGIRMLFYGLSGTGKTELARYLSEELNKKVLLKRASDILNKYVGETEQRIKEAFEEAAANDQILLFDEADSFFADRNSAKNSWERTQVNEFLTQMEEFPGILICTTNLRNIMDAALLRRFHITVEFKALKTDGIKKLLQKYFTNWSFTENQIYDLCSYDSVTPGDFSRLASRIRFMDEEEISSNLIIDELCKIQQEKLEGDDCSSGKRIGFALAG